MRHRLRTAAGLPANAWELFVSYLPGDSGFALRNRYWRRRLRKLGKNVRIDPGVHFENPAYISIDDDSWIDRSAVILAGPDRSRREKIRLDVKGFEGEPGVVSIGKRVHLGMGSIVSGFEAGVVLSDDCTLAVYCKVYSLSHHYRSRKRPGDTHVSCGTRAPDERQCMMVGPVWLGTSVLVAPNSLILPGVLVPELSCILTNSVVIRGRYPANSILVGNPAKRVGDRFFVGRR